jgi:hypothetical protein
MFSTAVAQSWGLAGSAAVSPWIAAERAPTAGTPLNLTAVDLSKIHDVSAAHQSFITDYINDSTHSKRHAAPQYAFPPPPDAPAYSQALRSPTHSEPLRVSQLQIRREVVQSAVPDARTNMSVQRPIIKGTHSEGKAANTVPRSQTPVPRAADPERALTRPGVPGNLNAPLQRHPERNNSIVDDALWKAASYVSKSFSEPTALSKAMAGGLHTAQTGVQGEHAVHFQPTSLAQSLFERHIEGASLSDRSYYSTQSHTAERPVGFAVQRAPASGDPTSGVSNRPPPHSVSSARPPFTSTGMYYSKQLASVSDGIVAAKKAAEAAEARIRSADADTPRVARSGSQAVPVAPSTPAQRAGSTDQADAGSMNERDIVAIQGAPHEVRHQYFQPSPPSTPIQQDKPQAKQLDMSDRADNGPQPYRHGMVFKPSTTAVPVLASESANIPLRPTGKSPRSMSAQLAESSERIRLWRASTQRPDESAMQQEYAPPLQPEFDDTTSWTLKRELQMADKQTSRAASVVRTSQAIEPGAKKLAPPKRAVDLRNLIHPAVASRPPPSGPKLVVGDKRERAEAQSVNDEPHPTPQWRSPVHTAEALAPVPMKMYPIVPYNGTSTITEPYLKSAHSSPAIGSRTSSPPSMWMNNTSANASRRGSTSQNSVVSGTSTMPDKVWVTRVLSEQRLRETVEPTVKSTWSIPQREEYTPARLQPPTPRVTVVPGSRAWVSDADVLRGLDALELESASPSLLFKHAL